MFRKREVSSEIGSATDSILATDGVAVIGALSRCGGSDIVGVVLLRTCTCCPTCHRYFLGESLCDWLCRLVELLGLAQQVGLVNEGGLLVRGAIRNEPEWSTLELHLYDVNSKKENAPQVSCPFDHFGLLQASSERLQSAFRAPPS